MAITLSTSSSNTAFTAGSVAASAVSVSSGDLIVVLADSTGTLAEPQGVSDTAVNSYSSITVEINSTSSVMIFYCLNAATHAANVVTVTYDSGAARKDVSVGVFTPDSGDTVTFDVSQSDGASYEAAGSFTIASTVSTTGDDEVCVAIFRSGNTGGTWSNREIPAGTGATLLEAPHTASTTFYRVLSATEASLNAEADKSLGTAWSGMVACFKSTAGVGGTTVGTLISGGLVNNSLIRQRLIG